MTKAFLCTLALMGSISLGVQAYQTKQTITSDTLTARLHFAKGNSLRASQVFDQAKTFFDRASKMYQKHQLWEPYLTTENKVVEMLVRGSREQEALKLVNNVIQLSKEKLGEQSPQFAEALYYKGDILSVLGKYQEAIDFIGQALNLFEDLYGSTHQQIGRCFQQLSIVYMTLGSFDKALKYANKQLAVSKELNGSISPLVAQSFSTLAGLFQRKGNLDSTIYYTAEAHELLKQLYKDKNPYEQLFSHNLGELNRELGNYDLSLEYHAQSQRILQKLNNRNQNLFSSYSAIGGVYHNKKLLDSAWNYYEKALQVAEELADGPHLNKALIYNNMALVLEDQEQFDRSIEYFNKGLSIERLLGTKENHPSIARIYANLGNVYKRKNELERAHDYYTLGLAIQKQRGDSLLIKHGIKNYFLVRSYYLLAELYSVKGEFERALHYSQQSLFYNVKNFSDTVNLSENPINFSAYYADYYLQTLALKASVFKSKYKASRSSEDLINSLKAYNLAYALVSHLRKSKLTLSDKVNLGEDVHKISEEAIAICLSLYDLTGDIIYKAKAFEFSERNLAYLVQQSINNSEAKFFANIPEALTRKEERLRVDKSFYQSKLLGVLNGDTRRETEDKLFEVHRSYDELVNSFESDYPAYYQLKYDLSVSSVKEIQKRLKPNELLLEFFRGDSSLFAFGITNQAFEILAIDNFSQVIGAALELHYEMTGRNWSNEGAPQRFASNANLLFEQLIKPVLKRFNEDRITNLIIVPDGELSYVPFSALLTSSTKAIQGFRDLPYLSKQFVVRQNYSATLMVRKEAKGRRFSNHSVLGVAPAYESLNSAESARPAKFRDNIGPLKYNVEEVRTIVESFEGRALLGNEALESAFKQQVNRYPIVHIAAHALIDDEIPMNSKLVLTQEKDSIEDGYLHAFELYNMRLTPELVVLSACNSGDGKLRRGEGLMSLSRAFAYAGVPSMVMSHWQVDDQATSKLMKLFYEQLAMGEGKADALRNAQLAFLETASAANTHPFYWAGFSLVGDSSPLTKKGQYTFRYILIALIGLPLLVFLLRKRRPT